MQAEYIKKDFNVNVTAMYVGGTEGHPELGHVSSLVLTSGVGYQRVTWSMKWPLTPKIEKPKYHFLNSTCMRH